MGRCPFRFGVDIEDTHSMSGKYESIDSCEYSTACKGDLIHHIRHCRSYYTICFCCQKAMTRLDRESHECPTKIHGVRVMVGCECKSFPGNKVEVYVKEEKGGLYKPIYF